MGRVYKALDVRMNLPVALKVVRPELGADERFRKLFDLEVRMAARFSHPHIVPLHDLGALNDGTPFLGLAFADAGSFAALRERASWKEMLRLTLEMLEALGHLHARGVLHRDLKPENVLLFNGEDKKPHVWLADLGLANASNQLAKKKGRVEGTPGFMAPEQKLGLPREYGPWTDLFSVGVILWELVTGALPFELGRSPLDAELPTLIPRPGLVVPDGLDIVLGNLLAAEPMSRYDIAADLKTELEALGPPRIDARAAAGRKPPRVGTVAPSAGAVSTSLAVPTWNRPRPSVLPLNPVPEPGLGATARASLPLFAMREIPLVARDAFRRVIWDMTRAVSRDGQSRCVLVIGETGAGKTKLVEAVARTLEEGGWAETVHLSWQKPAGKEDGYAGAARSLLRPWNETRASLEIRLRRQLARERGVLDDAVKEDCSQLARWCGLGDPGDVPVAAGYGLREVYRWLEARTWRGASVLAMDDAQWAVEEGDGLAIAESVLRGANDGQQKRLLVLATIRAEDLAHDEALQARVETLVGLGARRLDLPRLDRRGTESLLREYLTLTPDLMRRVAQRCEGNPLFARQLLLEWATRGWLVDAGELKYGLAEGVDADAILPADAEALFRERFEAMAQQCGDPGFLDVLHMGGLSGQQMPRGMLDHVAAPELLEFFRGSGLWIEKEDYVRWSHGLMHQSARQAAEIRDDAPDLHRRLMVAWEAYAGGGVDASLEIGRHALGAGDAAHALDHLLRAADRAWRRGRNKELDDATRLALEAAKSTPDAGPLQAQAQLWRARALDARGLPNESAEAYSAALTDFAASGNVAGATEGMIGLAGARQKQGQLAEAQKLLQDALRDAKARGDVESEAKALSGLAWLEQQKRNFEGADILFTRVLNRATQLGDRRGAAEAALGQAVVARRKGAFEEADELYAEAASEFAEGDDLLGVARARHGLAAVERQRLRVDLSEKLFREAQAIADELGATELVMDCRVGLADVHRLRGEFDRARRAYEAHVHWAEREHLFEAAIVGHLRLAHVALLQDDQMAMYKHAVGASLHLERVPGHWLWASYRLSVATQLALREDEDQTYRWLWSAAELGLADTIDHDIAYMLTIICHVASSHQWLNVMKVSSKLASGQWTALRLPDQVAEVAGLAIAVLGESGAR